MVEGKVKFMSENSEFVWLRLACLTKLTATETKRYSAEGRNSTSLSEFRP